MPAAQSFTFRIILAMVLMVGFYVIAITIALALISIPVAEVVFAGKLHAKLAIICIVGGCVILYSVMPRFDKFVAPGPRLTEQDQPELFAQIRSVATATNQSMPAEVYVVPEMNAWVANRGGIMGIGSRRVMGLGLPLMQVLTTQQFQGVLAHEFGHYFRGDTKLGPWIYVTRSAIVRTVVSLLQNGSSILSKPFEWYLYLFLWITQKVSRSQEYTADALAASIVGPDAMQSALKTIHATSLAFNAYWEHEYVPVLSSGFRAPLAEGFDDFFASAKIQTTIREALDQELKSSDASLFDSHPPLKDRIAAISSIAGPASKPNDIPFISLIRDLDALEVEVIRHLATLVQEKMPSNIEWADVTEKVWLPQWKSTIEQIGGSLKGLTLTEAISSLSSLKSSEKLIKATIVENVPATERVPLACRIVQLALLLALHREGWTIDAPVGEMVQASDGTHTIHPFELIDEKNVANPKTMQQCSELGISDLVLMPA